jgi:phosphoribosylformylglycinamidine synthase
MTADKVRALVLTGDGINCEMEMAHGFQLAGAEPVIAHLADVMRGEVDLQAFHILAFPGGFSFGDHLGSGKALANRIRQSSWWQNFRRFVADGKFVWGVCNGFQALVKLGLLPALHGIGKQDVSLVANLSGQFEDRWVQLGVNPASPCLYTQGLTQLYLPSRHGEGRLAAPPETLERLLAQGYVALQYVDADNRATEGYPDNPNGSPFGIAGLCDRTGRIFGLMPHPEAFLDFTNHPHWTRLKSDLRRQGKPVPRHGQGLALFDNVVRQVRRTLLAEGRALSLTAGR